MRNPKEIVMAGIKKIVEAALPALREKKLKKQRAQVEEARKTSAEQERTVEILEAEVARVLAKCREAEPTNSE